MNSRTVVVAIIAIFILFVSTISCNKTVEGDSITFQLTSSGDTIKSALVNNDFNEEDYIVIRCSSFTHNEKEIYAVVSKSKNLKATTLVFVKLNTDAETVTIAAANVTGKEYEYDISQAKWYEVTLLSADAAVSGYGIPFNDWQYGAVNNSEQFPCCQ